MPSDRPPDRVALIVDTSSLISDATQRGDDRAAAILTRLVAFLIKADADLSALESRRTADRERSRRVPQKSTESAEIRRISGTGALRSSSSSFSKRELEETTTTPRASPAESAVQMTGIDADVQQRIDLLRSAMADEFPAADDFVRRRQYSTWKGWLDEMLSLIGPGSQFVPSDLARVCKDDAALERPIGSPRGLRSFLGNARLERLNPVADAPAVNLPRPTPQQRALKALDGIQ